MGVGEKLSPSSFLVALFKKKKRFKTYLMNEYFACLYVDIPPECLVLVEVRRGYQVPWNWSCQQLSCELSCGCWELSPSLLEAQKCS